MTAGTYRRPDSAKAGAWPAYWDGRWFLSDFAGGTNIRHALLMDPATEIEGGVPVAADSLYGIIPTGLFNSNRTIDLDFGADGALYVASYSGSNFTISNANTGVWRFAYIGGDDTPGPDPQVRRPANSSKVDFNIGKSGGVSYEWTFPDGGTATGDDRHLHVPQRRHAEGHADGHLRRRPGLDARRSRRGPDHGAVDGHRQRPARPRPDARRGAATFPAIVAGRRQHVHGDDRGQRRLDRGRRDADGHRTRARPPRAIWSTGRR